MLTACQTSSSRFDNSIVLSVLLICSCFIFSNSQSFASDIRFDDLTKSISLTGDIEVGDSKKLKRAIERVPQNLIFTLSLDSDGGSLQEAKKISNLLNNYSGGFKTLISPGHRCFSSCAIIFMQGRAHDGDGYSSNNRSMSITSLLGFHAPFFGELSDGNYDKQQMLLAHKAAQLELEWIISTNEIPDDLLLEMMKAGPSEAYEIKYVWQAVKWGIDLTELRDTPTTLPLTKSTAANACTFAYDLELRTGSLVRQSRPQSLTSNTYLEDSIFSVDRDDFYEKHPGMHVSNTFRMLVDELEDAYCTIWIDPNGLILKIDESFFPINSSLLLLPPGLEINKTLKFIEEVRSTLDPAMPLSEEVFNSRLNSWNICVSNGESVELRKMPNIVSDVIKTFQHEQTVDAIATFRDPKDGTLWHKIKVDTLEGFVSVQNVYKNCQSKPKDSNASVEHINNNQSFHVLQNLDVNGILVEKSPAADTSVCQRLCTQNALCTGYTFNVWNSQCYLKSGLGSSKLEPSVVSGIRSGEPIPVSSAHPLVFQKYRDKMFEGRVLSTKTLRSDIDCQNLCYTSKICLAYSYVLAGNKCTFFSQAISYGSAVEVMSGVKRQLD